MRLRIGYPRLTIGLRSTQLRSSRAQRADAQRRTNMRRTSHASSTLASVLILVLFTLAGIAAFPGTARGGGPDSDGDGIPDDTDNCVNVANADQGDTAAEGLGTTGARGAMY